MIVFLVRLEMLSQFIDALAKQGNLNLGRTGISLVGTEVVNNLFLGSFSQSHYLDDPPKQQ